MVVKLQAGDFKNRARFEARSAGVDDYGNPVSRDWEEKFKVWVALRPGGLSEAVVAARLEGTQVLHVYVRASSQTRQITSEWRMIVTDHGVEREYAVSVQPDGVTMPGFIYFQAKSGTAA